jgi:hypothetical protein
VVVGRFTVRALLFSEHLPALAAPLGVAIAACHETRLDGVRQSLWADAWQEPPAAPPTALDCYSPLRGLGGAEHLAEPAPLAGRPGPPRGVAGRPGGG